MTYKILKSPIEFNVTKFKEHTFKEQDIIKLITSVNIANLSTPIRQ